MKKSEETKKRIKLIAWEMILIISTVLIFRGAWTLLDKNAFMNSLSGLWSSLLIGIAVALVSICMIYKCTKK